MTTRLLTVAEVAALLGTTPDQIRNMRRRGQGPRALKLAGLGLRYREADVEAWLAEAARAAEAA